MHPLRLLLAAWLITWITAVPLFHVHIPDTTDRWSAVQSGGPHTVFTPSLPGEFSHPFRDHFGHVSQRAVNSPELSFTLFSDTDPDQKGKQVSFVNAHGDGPDVLGSSWPFQSSGTYRGPPPSHAYPDLRAPPRVVCA
jgi:hypothetical protein